MADLITLIRLRDARVHVTFVPHFRLTAEVSDSEIARSIVTLDCRYCKLSTLPSGMICLLGLECSHNLLDTLPSGMISLQELYCFNNQLVSLPSDMVSLRFLCCSLNWLESLPSGMSSLRRLYCSNNRLQTLPPMFSLTTLACAHNFFTNDSLTYWLSFWAVQALAILDSLGQDRTSLLSALVGDVRTIIRNMIIKS